MAIGHTVNSAGDRQSLEAHLAGVARAARTFAEPLGAGDAGYWLGLWHDLGKFHPRFQAYLRSCEADPRHREYVDHKAAGAILADQHLDLLSMIIQAHHGGLRDPGYFKAWLDERVATGEPEQSLTLARQSIAELEPDKDVRPPAVLRASRALDLELFVRMLYSALVDADSVDTERHYFPEKAFVRAGIPLVGELWDRFQVDQASLLAQAPKGELSMVRRIVYEAAITAAGSSPGFFRLAVPTGGGKTRTGLGFALRHASLHGLDRVIVAVPFLTITEQTADEYRRILDPAGTDAVVLEHHSQAALAGDDDRADAAATWAALAAEDWDAPVVVTTTVRLFESLFANGRADCRRLHRLARSVIVIDEAQALPSRVLTPIVDMLTDLVTNYGTTVVISTATQPAFDVIPEFRRVQARDIVPARRVLYRDLRRVRYDWRLDQPMTWSEVASLMRTEAQVMAIVNTKPDAHALLEALDDRDAVHLSTTLCGAHRRDVLELIKERIHSGEPCHVVTTQVVEAGVDIDFPVVLRALCPLDSIIQAAGRCNREGRLAEGNVVVFEPADGRLPPGTYTTATGRTRVAVAQGIDMDDPEAIEAYFRRLLVPPFTDTDALGVQKLRDRLQFEAVGRTFRMIDEDTESVVVRYRGLDQEGGAVDELLADLRAKRGSPKLLWRRAQPFVVSLRRRDAMRYREAHLITELLPGLGEWHGAYDAVLGLRDGIGPELLLA